MDSKLVLYPHATLAVTLPYPSLKFLKKRLNRYLQCPNGLNEAARACVGAGVCPGGGSCLLCIIAVEIASNLAGSKSTALESCRLTSRTACDPGCKSSAEPDGNVPGL